MTLRTSMSNPDATRHSRPDGQPERTPADLGWAGQPRVPLWDPLRHDDARVTLGMVVQAHHLSVSPDQDEEVRQEAELLERLLLAKFERQCGPIHNSYLCRHARGGAAIVGPDRELHTVLRTATARLVVLEADCQALAHQTRETFSDSRGRLNQRRPLTDAIYSAMTRVLTAADLTEKATTDGQRDEALAAAEKEVEHVTTRVRTAIQRQARFVYFQGALVGTVGTIALSVLLGVLGARFWSAHLSVAALVAATLFGALGAVVSVFQRISTGRLTLDFNASAWQLRSLGALRPLVGAIFGTVAQFTLSSGLFGATNAPTTNAFGVFALIGFAAGFSERFATDMVERAGRVLAADQSASETTGTRDPV